MKKEEEVHGLRQRIHAIEDLIKKDITGPIVASFGFIVALIWRDAIQSVINEILDRMGINNNLYIYQIISAVIVTIIVIFIMLVVIKFREKKIDKIKQGQKD